MIETLKKLLYWISNLGLDNRIVDEELRQKIKISNILAILVLFIATYITIYRFLYDNDLSRLFSILFIIALTLVYIISKNPRTKIKLIFISTGYLFPISIVLASIIAKFSLSDPIPIEDYLYPKFALIATVSISVLLIPYRYKIIFFSSLFLNLVLYVSLDSIYSLLGIGIEQIGMFPNRYPYVNAIAVSDYLLIMITLFVLVYFSNNYRIQLQKINKEITDKNNLLKEQNSLIINQSEKLSDTNEELENILEKMSFSHKKLQEIIDSKDNFLSILAHDLKNQIFGITLSLYTLSMKQNKLTSEELNAKINKVYKESLNIQNLLIDLLQWSRNNMGKLEFIPIEKDIKEIIEEVCLVLSIQAKSKNIEIVCDYNHLNNAEIDIDMMGSVIRNLISNAIKFSYRGSTIKVLTDQINNTLIISITDYGTGILSTENIFKFDQRHSTRGTESERGTGLGLALCSDFVERHRGSLSVDTEYSKGSTFTVKIPVRRN